ncbi:Exocyst complex, component Exoc1, partial [Corchorus capsularis]
MAKSSADDEELRRACEAAIEGTKQKIVLSTRVGVAKSRGIWGKSGKLGRHMAKPRVLALSMKSKGQRTKAFHIGLLRLGWTSFMSYWWYICLPLWFHYADPVDDPVDGFDNLRIQSVSPPQWTMRNIDDRNRLLLRMMNICKDVLGRLPKVVGIDAVEMALWAKENTPSVPTQRNQQDGQPVETTVTESELKVTVEKELVSQAEEEDMEALLGHLRPSFYFYLEKNVLCPGINIHVCYVMGIGEAEAFSERLKRELLALEAANVHAILESEPLVDEVLQGLEAAAICVDDMDEWLGIFNVKLRHMREDIESVETFYR